MLDSYQNLIQLNKESDRKWPPRRRSRPGPVLVSISIKNLMKNARGAAEAGLAKLLPRFAKLELVSS